MKRFAAGLFLGLLILGVAGLWILRSHGLAARFESVPPGEFGRIEPLPPPPEDVRFIRSVLPDTVTGIRSIVRWTVNLTSNRDDPAPVESAERAFRLAAEGRGLLCGHLSRLLATALVARGYQAREVQLARSLFSSADTHVATEVMVDGEWVLYDPTFHVRYERAGEPLGAAGIHRLLVNGDREVEPVFLGDVAYPARLETYPVAWQALFNNVLVLDRGAGWLGAIPPFRYWSGPRWYVLTDRGDGRLWHVAAASDFYVTFVVVIPLTLIAVVLLELALLIRARKRRPWLRPPGRNNPTPPPG